MKITSKELKTIVHVELTSNDYWKLRSEAADDPLRLGAWDEHDLTDTRMGTAKTEFKNWQFIKGHTKIVKYINRKLGFDGIENYGCYYENRGVVRYTAYMYGDCMNVNI